jgi:hypothetical protein
MTPRHQIEQWIHEQAAKDGMPATDADYERLTKRVMLAHKDEFTPGSLLTRFCLQFTLSSLLRRKRKQ